nr:cell adhesion molecule-related/down-regulated by oncogenes [Parasteatoda tepidariorum]
MCSNEIAFVVILASLFSVAFSNSNLEFIQEPISRLVKTSEGRAVFRCEASPPGAEILWSFKGGPLPHNRWIKVSDQKLTVLFGKMDNSSRSAHFLEFFSDAYFQCEIRFKGKALVSPPANLYIAVLDDFPPQPLLHISAIVGNTAVIPCDPPHSIPTVVTEFSFNNKIIDRTTGNKHIMPSGDLQIFDAKREDSGEYICIANNPYLAERVKSKRKIILHIIEPTEFKAVSLVKTPSSKVSAALGRNLTLECAAAGNPKPTIRWRRDDDKELSDERYQQQGGNLQIMNIKRVDEGTYFCEASDSMGNQVFKSCNLEIQETPQISRAPNDVVVEVGHNFTLHCQNRGHPKPSLKWVHNGREMTDSKNRKGAQLIIQNVHQKHAGIYQCMATNSLGTAMASATVTVTSGNVSLDFGYDDEEEDRETRNPYHSDRERFDDQNSDDSKRSKDHNSDIGKRHHKKKHFKGVKLIPPSKPEINRLSNTSVMVRWTAADGGLPINFYKLQYKEVGRRKTNWMTIDEDIAAHIHSYAVVNLKTGGAYRFRIAAVYSNSDNRDGPISDKFVLVKDTPMEKPCVIPIITYAEAVSQSAITLQWEYQEVDSIQTDGFFIHYRATHMAGKYLKVSVLGSNTRSHIISHLLPDTGYDIKMQSFNRAGTSDFSNIFTAKTKGMSFKLLDLAINCMLLT